MNKREILKELKSIVNEYDFLHYVKSDNEFLSIAEGILEDIQLLIEKIEEGNNDD